MALTASAQAQTPTKEYIRLGDRVIAIENGAAPVISPAIVTIGSIDTQTFTATCGSAACSNVTWTTAGGGHITSAGVYTPPNQVLGSPYTASVSVTATAGGVSSTLPFTVQQVLTPFASYDFPAQGPLTLNFNIYASGNWSIQLSGPFTFGASSQTLTGNGPQPIQITAAPNSGGMQTGSAIVTTPTGSETFTLTQDASGATQPSISVSPTTSLTSPLTIGGQGNAAITPISVTVNGGAQWSITTTASWITGLPIGTQTTSQTIPWGAVPNTGTNPRTATLTVSTIQNGAVIATTTVYISQSGGLTFNPPFGSETHLSPNSISETFTVTAPAGTTWTVTGLPTWLTVTPMSGGPGVTQLTYSATPPITQQATATFYVGGQQYEVEEDPGGFTVSPGNWQLLPSQSTLQFTASFNSVSVPGSYIAWTSSSGVIVSNGPSTPGCAQPAGVLCIPAAFPGGSASVTATYVVSGTTYSATAYGAVVVTGPGQNWGVGFGSGQMSGNNNYLNVTLPGSESNFVTSNSTNPYTLLVAITNGSSGGTPTLQNSCYISWTFNNSPYFPISLFGNDAQSLSLTNLSLSPDPPFYNANQPSFNAGFFFGSVSNSQVGNSQCWWDLSDTALVGFSPPNGNLETSLHILFNPAWSTSPTKQVWIKFTNTNNSGVYLPWTEFSTYTVSGYAPPSVAFGTATSQAASNSSSTPITGSLTLSGWAVDNPTVAETSIQSVKIYVDNQFVGPATIGQSVPGGSSVPACTAQTQNFAPQIPNCPSAATANGTATTPLIPDTSWWTYSWNPAGLSNGAHTVTAVALDNDPTPTGPQQTTSQSLTFYVANSAPNLTISSQHTGNFTQGDTGDIYTISVTNAGGSPASGTVTVTDSLPAGLTATSFGGNGWTGCTALPVTGPATLTCSRSDALATSSSYAPLILAVNVSASAAGSVTNSVTVAGGGSQNNSGSDPTTINSAPFQVTINTFPTGVGLLVSIDGGTPAGSVTATWRSSDAPHQISTTSPQGSGGTQYTWTKWSDLGNQTHNVSATPGTTTYTADFATLYQLTVSATNGTVSQNPSSGPYYLTGTVVTLTATPSNGYIFSSWTGNVANPTSASTTVTMSQVQSVVANFVASSSVATPTFSPIAGTYTSAQTVTISTTTSGASIRYTIDGSSPSETAGILYSGAFTVSTTTTVKAIAYKAGMPDSSVNSATYTISAGSTSITRVQSIHAYPGSSATFNSNNATGNAIVVAASWSGTTETPTISDSQGNTYSALPILRGSGSGGEPVCIAIWYALNIRVGGNAITISGLGLDGGMTAVEYSGVATSAALGITSTQNGFGGTATTTPTSNSVTPSAGSLLFATFADETNVQSSIVSGSGFTLIQGDGQHIDIEEDALNSTPTAQTASMTLSSATSSWIMYLMELKAAAGQQQVATPTFSPAAGSYSSAQSVTINTTTSGASIRYTTDGSSPSETAGTLYGGTTISVSSTQTLKAIAYLSGWTDSSIASATYTITGTVATPTFNVASGTYATAQSVAITTTTSGASIRYTTDGSSPSETAGTLYIGTTVTVSSTETLKAIAYLSGWTDSAVSSASYTITGTVATPTFSIASGTYATAQSVAISTTTSGASIRYTTDGSSPSETAGTLYTGTTVTVSSTETLKAIAYLSGWTDSSVASAAYTITGTVATPTFSVASGTYTSAQNVTISTTTSGASIRYTTNGSTPSETAGTLYSGTAVAVSSTETLKAIAYLSGWTDSSVASASYTITGTVAAPTFSPAAGTYTSAQSVAISTTTSGASIRYTTDGSTPSETAGTLYGGMGVAVNSTETLKAIAYLSGWTDSTVASAAYTITATVATPTFSVASGTYNVTQTVSITSATSGASIRYSTNGTAPSETYGTLYTGPITVGSTTAFQAIAYKSGMNDSAVASVSYTITPIVVTVSPSSPSISLGQTQSFSASLTNTSNQAVTWSVGGVGTISSSGVYTPPLGAQDGASATIFATSVVDPTRSGSASLTIYAPSPPTVTGTLPTAPLYTATYYNYSVAAQVTGTVQTVDLWIPYNTSQVSTYGCAVHYDSSSNQISVGGLDGNGNAAWLYSAAPGTSGAVYSGYLCTVDISQSSISTSFGTTTLQLSISYNPSPDNYHIIGPDPAYFYAAASDYSGLTSGTVLLGGRQYYVN